MPIPQLQRPREPQSDEAERERRFHRSWREVQTEDTGGPSSSRFRSILLSIAVKARKLLGRVWALRRQRQKKEQFLRFWLPLAGVVALTGILGLIVVFAWFSRDLPNPDRISDRSIAQSTRIYARDGKTLLYEIHGEERRTIVDLQDVAPDVVNATIAIEDKDFRRHKGFSLTGIVRALWRDITTGSSQGGSTITQQFVKNAVLTREKRLTRKVRELVLAYQIERRFTKDQILKLYFNEIPYGSSAYGVEAAAETYFGKPAKNLTLAESAVLAALPQAPTFYSPYGNHTDKLVGRAHYILDLMVEQGYTTKELAEAAKAEDVLKNVKPKRETILAPHFVFFVRELLTQKYGERIVERGGLRVTTTLDIDQQLAAEQAIAEQSPINEKRYDAENAALVAVDPRSGQILAMVGSRDYFNKDIDGNVNVALTLQQPGSSIKPIVYATAFSRGFTPETMLFDLKTRFKIPGSRDYVPQNYDGKNHGPVSMRKALAGSLNIPAVKTLLLAGLDHVIDQAQRMGYTTWDDRTRLGPSLVLGGGDVTLIDHVTAFGSFATDGVLHTTTPILKIEDKTGKMLEEFKDRSSRVLDENIARVINGILSDNEARSFIFGSRSRLVVPGFNVAAKTGTTQEFRDAWTLGYSRTLVAGVWVGNTRNRPMRAGADGSVVAAPIWNSFMRKALAGTKTEPFKKYAPPKVDKPVLQGKLEGEAPIKVDRVTKREIPASCLDAWPEEFVEERVVRAVHTILYYVDPKDPTGPPPKDPNKNLQFASWEEAVQAWAKKNNYVDKRPETESCDLRTKLPAVVIRSPTVGATIRGDSVIVDVEASGPRPIAGVQYWFDDQSIPTSVANSLGATVDLRQSSNGFHSIRVLVTDDVGNSAEAKIDVNLLRDLSTTSFYFITPNSSSTVAAGSVVSLKAFAYDPGGVSTITFFFVTPDGAIVEIGASQIAADSTATIEWAAPSGPATYRVFFRAASGSGHSLQSDYLAVVVR